MKSNPLRALRSTEASEIAEAALVLPIVFLFLLGIVWFGRAFNIYSTIQQAAQQGAIYAARPNCATCGNTFPLDGSVNGPTCTAKTVACAVSSVMLASGVDPTKIPPSTHPPAPTFCPTPYNTQYTKCSTPSNISVCREVLLNAPTSSTQPPVCGVLVSFQYQFQLSLPFTSLNWSQITLTAQAQSRMEN